MADSAALDRIPLASLTAVGLGKPKLIFESPSASWSARTAMIAVGIGLVALGSSSDLYAAFAGVFRRVRWKDVVTRIVHMAECSRWFYTVINITREVHKRW